MEKIKFEFTKKQVQEIVTCILFRHDYLVRSSSAVNSALSFDDRLDYLKDLYNELCSELEYLNTVFSAINKN